MRSVTSTVIKARARDIYDVARSTERWPEFLPHYRFVRVLRDDGESRTIEMAAKRGIFPVRWTAVQENDPQTCSIRFRHIRGWTSGMDVAWILDDDGTETTVSIVHDVAFRFPIARRSIERYVVTEFFIEGIARRTLACMKSLLEGAHRGT